jgi:DNA repair protein RadC
LENNVLQNQTVEVAPSDELRRGPGDRPERQRLLRHGARNLGTAELLTLVLGPGGRPGPALVARLLLERYPEPAHLARQPLEALLGLPGMGPGRAGRLQAACELGRRLSGPAAAPGLRVTGPEAITGLLRRELGGLDREHVLALYLDARHCLLALRTVSVGTLDASLVHPREVFRPAVNLQAAAVVLAHNHPSGCSRPSGDDLELTRRLIRCGRLLGIELLDHLVVGDSEVTSIREAGWPAGAGSPHHEGTDR